MEVIPSLFNLGVLNKVFSNVSGYISTTLTNEEHQTILCNKDLPSTQYASGPNNNNNKNQQKH